MPRCGVVHEPGSRTRTTLTFMLPADIAQFSEQVAAECAGLGMWHPYDSPDLYPTLTQALEYGRGQAFLRLVRPDREAWGPIIQFLTSSIRIVPLRRTILPDGRHIPIHIDRETMQDGRLAYKWFPDEHPSEVQDAFPELARRAWKALKATTHPHLAKVLTGKPVNGPRIGPAAKQWIRDDPDRGLLGVTVWYQLAR
jgi:hypothetical protein